MDPFEKYLVRKLSEGIMQFTPSPGADVYVLSLYIDLDEGPTHPKIWLYYNTRTRLQQMIQSGEDPQEAKWNFALWVEDFITAIGLRSEESIDLADAEFDQHLVAWLSERGLYRSDYELEIMRTGPYRELYGIWERCARQDLLSLYVMVARQLQENGIIAAKFRRPAPLLVHEWEYNLWTAVVARFINDPYLVRDFEQWLQNELWWSA